MRLQDDCGIFGSLMPALVKSESAKFNLFHLKVQSPTSKNGKHRTRIKVHQTSKLYENSKKVWSWFIYLGVFIYWKPRNVHPSHPNCASLLCIDLLLPSTSPTHPPIGTPLGSRDMGYTLVAPYVDMNVPC